MFFIGFLIFNLINFFWLADAINQYFFSLSISLGFYRDAKLALKNLLQLNEKYVPALKVMAECLLNESREYLLQAIDKNVVDNCQDAVTYLVTAIEESSK